MTRSGWLSWPVTSAGSRQRSRQRALTGVLADLRRAAAANPASTAVAAVVAAVTGQAYDLRPPQPVDQPGYILRQLWMQAAELAEDDLAEEIRSRLQSRPGPGLVPRWTTRRASRALSGELGRHDGTVVAVAVLADGRVVTGGGDRRVLVWDPAHPGAGPAELGRHDGWVQAVAVLADGRVVTGGNDGRVLVWDPAHPGAGPAELGRHDGAVEAVAVLADGRVVTGGNDGRVLVWDPAHPGAGPAELGRHDTPGAGGGGAGRRAGGHRRGRRAGAGVGPGPSRRRPGRAGPPRRVGWLRWRCWPTGGWSPAGTTGGCWCGTRPIPAPARSSWAATAAV